MIFKIQDILFFVIQYFQLILLSIVHAMLANMHMLYVLQIVPILTIDLIMSCNQLLGYHCWMQTKRMDVWRYVLQLHSSGMLLMHSCCPKQCFLSMISLWWHILQLHLHGCRQNDNPVSAVWKQHVNFHFPNYTVAHCCMNTTCKLPLSKPHSSTLLYEYNM